MKWIFVTTLILIANVALGETGPEKEMGPFHGAYYTCFNVSAIHDWLASKSSYFSGWSPKELSDFRSFINSCKASYPNEVNETLPLVDALKNSPPPPDQVQASKEFEALSSKQSASAAPSSPEPLPQLDPRCSKPPYGDMQAVYKLSESSFKNLAIAMSKTSGVSVRDVTQKNIPAALQAICEAKFDHGSRSIFYAVDMTDQDFEAQSTTTLALQYIAVTNTLDDLKKNARAISIEDFILDGEAMAAKQQQVSIAGIYVADGQDEVLYADSAAVAAARYNYQYAGKPLTVSLLTKHAIRHVRKNLLFCQSHYAQTGCPVRLLGQVVPCTQTYISGAQTNLPCLNVWDSE
jgi:hypothetical protein